MGVLYKIKLPKEVFFSQKNRAIGPNMRIFPTIARLICLGEWQVCGRYAQPEKWRKRKEKRREQK